MKAAFLRLLGITNRRGNQKSGELNRPGSPLVIDALEGRVLFSGAPVESGAEEEKAAADTAPADAGAPMEQGGVSDETGSDQTAEIAADAPVTLLSVNSATAQLNAETLQAIAAEAKARWIATGLSADQIAALDGVTYQIADLGGSLGTANGQTITIDDDAAGSGAWFVDGTPDQDEDFSGYDLLSAVLHEQGHVIGLSDLDGDGANTMNEILSQGARRLPLAGQAAGATPGSQEGEHALMPPPPPPRPAPGEFLHAVAWTETNGTAGYQADDQLIAKIVDDGDEMLGTGDTIVLGSLPASFSGSPRYEAFITEPVPIEGIDYNFISGSEGGLGFVDSIGRSFSLSNAGKGQSFNAYGSGDSYIQIVDYFGGLDRFDSYDLASGGELFDGTDVNIQDSEPSGDSSFLNVAFGVSGGTPQPTATTSVAVDGSGNLVIDDVAGGNTDDNLTIVRDGGDFLITDPTNGITRRVAASSVAGDGDVIINGTGGDDTLTIDLRGGAPGRNIVFNGGAGGFDTLIVIGTGGETIVYNPDTTDFGDGVLDIGGGNTITFTGLEPIDIIGAASFSLALTGANDIITVAEGLNINGDAALILSGTSGGVAFEMARVRNTTTVTIDTTVVDGTDTITVTGAANAHGNTNLEIITGNTGTDNVTISGAATFAGDVLIQTRDFDLNALLTAQNATIRPQSVVGGTIAIGTGAAVSVMTLTEAQLTTNLALGVGGTLTVGRADGAGTINVGSLDTATTAEGYDFVIVNEGRIRATGAVLTDGDISWTSNSDNAGANGDLLLIAGSSIATSGTISLVSGTGADVSIVGDLTSTGAGNAITITSGRILTPFTSVVSTNNGNVNVSAPGLVTFLGTTLDLGIGDLTVNAGDNINVDGTMTVNTADALTFNAGLQGIGAETFDMGIGGSIVNGTVGANSVDIISNTPTGGMVVRTVEVANNGTITIDLNGTANLDIRTGTLLAGGTGTVTVTSSGSIDLDGAIDAGGTVTLFASGAINAIDGSISSDAGDVDLDAGTLVNVNGLVSAGDEVTVDAGTAITVGAAGNITAVSTAVLTSGTSTTLQGLVNAGTGATVNSSGLITVNGTVASSAGGVTLRGTDLTVNAATGNITAGAGGDIRLRRATSGQMGVNSGAASVYRVDDAEISRMTGGRLIFGDPNAGTNNVTGIIVDNAVDTTAEISGEVIFNTLGSVEFDAGAVTAFNALTVNADLDENGTGNFIADPGITIDTSSTGGDIVLNAADFVIGAGATISSGAGDISVLPTQTGRTVELGGSGLGADVTLTDAELDALTTTTGTLRIGDADTGDITITASVSRPGGTGAAVLTSGGSLSDTNGALDWSGGSLTVNADITPGASPGILDVTGDFTFADNNTFTVEIDGLSGPGVAGGHDQVAVGGDVTIGSNVLLNLVNNFLSELGDTFTIVNNQGPNPVSGRFVNALNNTVLNEGDWFISGLLAYTISYSGGDGNDIVLNSLGEVETEVSIGGGGQLVITDVNGGDTNDSLTIQVVGSVVRIHDNNVRVGFSGVPGAVQVDLFTVDVPLSALGLEVETLGGNDTVTMSGNFGTSFLQVDAGTGVDSLSYVGNATLAGNVEMVAERIFINKSNLISTGGTIDLDASDQGDGANSGTFNGLEIRGSILTASGDITLLGAGGTATGGSSGGNSGVELSGASHVTSTSGQVTIRGTGGTSAEGGNFGVVFYSASTVSASGNLSIFGNGGVGGANNNGVYFSGVSTGNSTGAGITISGTGNGNGTGDGVEIIGSSSLTASGAISITGTGANLGIQNTGVSISSSKIITTGTGGITLTGTGGAGTDNNIGVQIVSNGNVTTAGVGSILISGNSLGTGKQNYGVSIGATSMVRVSGAASAGSITVDGIGGNGTQSNDGVQINSSTLRTGNGGIAVTGTGRGNGASNRGLLFNKATVQTLGNGAITLIGTATQTASGTAATSNDGVYLNGVTNVNTAGTGGITITGNGGTGSKNNYGVRINGASVTSGVSATTSITGTASALTTSTGNMGVIISGTNTINGGGGSSVAGTGGGSTSGSGNHGISVTAAGFSTNILVPSFIGTAGFNAGVTSFDRVGTFFP